MEGKLDKLFKEKLARHKVNPSDHAWDQISHQLAGKRRSAWTKRLAVAASFLILISAISIGYLYIDRIQSSQPKLTQSKTTENPEIKSELEDEITTPSSKGSKSSEMFADQPDPKAEPSKNQIIESRVEKSMASTQQPESTQNEIRIQTVKENEMILPVELNPEIAESQKLLADNILIENVELNEKAQINDSQKLPDSIEQPGTKKTYPKIRIVYKADENSDLVASSNKTLINKGIKKITKFSDEHIMTDQVKTKLRNTKDDLLALNFGKILNKSNREIDN